MTNTRNRKVNKGNELLWGDIDQGMRWMIDKDAQVRGMKLLSAGYVKRGEKSKDILWKGGELKRNKMNTESDYGPYLASRAIDFLHRHMCRC